MSEKQKDANCETTSFVQRWSRRKLQHQDQPEPEPPQPEVSPEQAAPLPINETDLPPIDSLHEDSEVGLFFSEGISESLKRQALRRLFHFGKFNVCDGLDDYAEDYTVFQPLSDLYEARQKLKSIADKIDHDETEKEQNQTVAAIDSDIQQTEAIPAPDEYRGDDDDTREE